MHPETTISINIYDSYNLYRFSFHACESHVVFDASVNGFTVSVKIYVTPVNYLQ